MAKIINNAEQALREQFEEIDSNSTSFKEYVMMCSESNPSFFRWFFGESFNNDFDIDLKEEHRILYEAFIDAIS